MSEVGEIPLKVKDQVHLQGLTEKVVLNRPEGLGDLDRRRITEARRLLDVSKFNEGLQVIEGDNTDLVDNLQQMVDSFGVDRTPTGAKDRSPAEKDRHSKGKKSLEAIIPIIESAGYDQMEAPQQKDLRDKMQLALQNTSRLRGFNNMDAAQQQEIVEEFLRDPKLKGEVLTLLRRVQGMSLTSERDIREAEKALKVSEAKKTEGEQRKTELEADVRSVQDKIDKIGSPVTSSEGKHINETLDTIKESISKLDDQVETLQDALDGLERPVREEYPDQKAFNAAAAEYNYHVSAYKAELAKAENRKIKYLTHQTELMHRLDQLSPNEDELEAKREERRAKASEARLALAGTPEEYAERQMELSEMKHKREQEETAIVRELEGVFSKAVERYVAKKLDTSFQQLATVEGKVRTDAAEDIINDIKRQIEHRWTTRVKRPRGLLRKSVDETVQNTVQVNKDFDTLMQEGPDQILKTLLRNSPAVRASGTEEDVKAQIDRMMDDDQFTAQCRSEIIKRVVGRRALVKPFRPGEVQHMMEMESIKDSIQTALSSNEAYRKQVQDLTGTNDIDMDKTDFKNRFYSAAMNHPGLLLFPLTAIPWAIWSALRATWEVNNSNERTDLARQIAA